MRNICFTDTSYLIFLDILFVFKVKRGTFLPIHRYVHFDLISNIFLCRDASITLRIKLLTWCGVISLAGLKFVKIFRANFEPSYKTFYNITSNDFFLSWRRFVVCGNFCEWSDCDVSSANSVCKHSCVLPFSAGISLTLFLGRRQRWGN